MINQVHISKGTKLVIPNHYMNCSPALWGPDSMAFNPNRWLDGSFNTSEAGQTPGRLYTFGDGPRTCIGRVFAVVNLKICSHLCSLYGARNLNGRSPRLRSLFLFAIFSLRFRMVLIHQSTYTSHSWPNRKLLGGIPPKFLCCFPGPFRTKTDWLESVRVYV